MKRLLTVGSVLVLAACSNNTENLGRDFGNAFEQNRTAHIINPAPSYDAPAFTDGQRTSGAFHRYIRGEVRQPGGVSTSDTGGGESN